MPIRHPLPIRGVVPVCTDPGPSSRPDLAVKRCRKGGRESCQVRLKIVFEGISRPRRQGCFWKYGEPEELTVRGESRVGIMGLICLVDTSTGLA